MTRKSHQFKDQITIHPKTADLQALTNIYRPSGNFLITYHPTYKNLFIATGGSGHGFKFFPVIGDKIVAAIEGTLDPELKQIWRWRTDDELRKEIGGELHEFSGCDDGSRSGRRGMILEEELKRTR